MRVDALAGFGSEGCVLAMGLQVEALEDDLARALAARETLLAAQAKDAALLTCRRLRVCDLIRAKYWSVYSRFFLITVVLHEDTSTSLMSCFVFREFRSTAINSTAV
jgi:hypothetical protein